MFSACFEEKMNLIWEIAGDAGCDLLTQPVGYEELSLARSGIRLRAEEISRPKNGNWVNKERLGIVDRWLRKDH